MNKKTAALVQAIREHAQANYETDGWDYVVEAYEDEDIINEIGDAQTAGEAIKRIALNVGAVDEHRQEMTPIAGWHY